MPDLNRREVLAGAVAAAAVAALPVAGAAIVEAVPAPVAPPEPAWIVGTPGEFDWQAMGGATEREARLAWLAEAIGERECEEGGADPRPECNCEFCSNFGSIEARRMPEWDGREVIDNADWFRAGLGTWCARCSDETFPNAEGHLVGEDVVCEDCMTIADWDIVDPEHAAELRADAEEEGRSV